MSDLRSLALRYARDGHPDLPLGQMPMGCGEVIALLDELAQRVRLHDLIRHQRGSLHDAGLLTDAEYADLAADHGAVARLETYDGMRARIEALEVALSRAKPDHPLVKIAGPWEPDTSGGALGWIDGTCRKSPAGVVVAYAGTLHGEPTCGTLDSLGWDNSGDIPGGEPEADAALVAEGWTLSPPHAGLTRSVK